MLSRLYCKMQKTQYQYINRVISKPRVQVSAQNICCGKCTQKLQVLALYSCRLTLGGNLSCHYCCKVAFLS